MSEQNTPEWMKDELVREIPPEKLELLQELFIEADNRVKKAGPAKSNQEMLLTMMPLLKKARERHLIFTPSEMQAAVAALDARESVPGTEPDGLGKAHPTSAPCVRP